MLSIHAVERIVEDFKPFMARPRREDPLQLSDQFHAVRELRRIGRELGNFSRAISCEGPGIARRQAL